MQRRLAAATTALIIGLGVGAGALNAPASAAPTAPAAAGTAALTASADVADSPRAAKPRNKRAKRPVVKAIKPRSGKITGGTVVTVKGMRLKKKPVVKFGGVRAAIIKKKSNRLKVRVPVNTAGKAKVKVSTSNGVARKKPRFTYRTPSARNTSRYTRKATTYVARNVQWVGEGPDPADPQGTAAAPYVVSLAPGSTPPTDGQQLLVPTGSTARPQGLHGTVQEIAYQIDGSIRVTLARSPLYKTLKSAHVHVSTALKNSSAANRAPAKGVNQAVAAPSFGTLAKSAFECKTKQGYGTELDFSELKIEFSNLHAGFDLDVDVLTWHPTYAAEAWLSGDMKLSGEVSTKNEATCQLSEAWQNAHRRIVFLGTSGATITFAPAAEFSVSAGGSVTLSHTTHFVYGARKEKRQGWQSLKKVTDGGSEVNGSASLSVSASLGVQMRLGYLDAIGADVNALLTADGSLALRTTPRPNLCATVGFSVHLKIGAFYDVRVASGHKSLVDISVPLKEFEKCLAPEDDDTPDIPVITSTTLGDATVGAAYETHLQTSDGRSGFWSIRSGSLPPGLRLTTAGELSGTPTGGIGTHQIGVRFTDPAQGQHADTTVVLRVLPERGLGGGDIQATLAWSGTEDLDLHALDVDGTEIYYGNPGPTTNGGELDHDANPACYPISPTPAENIRWNGEDTASGAYGFWIEVYDTCDDTDLSWHLVVRVNGQIKLDRTGTGDSDRYSLGYDHGRVTVNRSPAPKSEHAAKRPGRA